MTANTLIGDLKKVWLFVVIAAVPLSADAQGMRYERIDYPKAIQTLITGVNDDGTIIGTYTLGELPRAPKGTVCVSNTHMSCGASLVDAFIYRHKTFSMLRSPEGSSIRLVAINNHDQVLLQDSHGNGNTWFLYDIAKDLFTPIGMLGNLSTASGVKTIHLHVINGLNDKGEILAGANSGRVSGRPALGVPGSLTAPSEPGNFTAIPNCPGGNLDVRGINALEQVVGTCHLARYNAEHASFTGIMYRDGSFESVIAPDAIVTIATAINNRGVIIGYHQPQKTLQSRSFIFDGKTLTDLPVLFNPNGALPEMIRASGINNHGDIVGTVQGGINNGTVEGFLATPIAGSGGQ
jgi:hypothetical protein